MPEFKYNPHAESTYKIAEEMAKSGGSFVKKLAELFFRADGNNRLKIVTTWENYFDDYDYINHPKRIFGMEIIIDKGMPQNTTILKNSNGDVVAILEPIRLNQKGQCPFCLKKSLIYKRINKYFCSKCARDFDLKTGIFQENWHWTKDNKCKHAGRPKNSWCPDCGAWGGV